MTLAKASCFLDAVIIQLPVGDWCPQIKETHEPHVCIGTPFDDASMLPKMIVLNCVFMLRWIWIQRVLCNMFQN